MWFCFRNYWRTLINMKEKIMSLIMCPECGNEVSDKAASCPKCGYLINKVTEEERESNAKAEAF